PFIIIIHLSVLLLPFHASDPFHGSSPFQYPSPKQLLIADHTSLAGIDCRQGTFPHIRSRYFLTAYGYHRQSSS
ncbi:hypothetical protein OSM86_23720, partial [Escherichia coli]|nr:hypothetical protein [Escherichia coli]